MIVTPHSPAPAVFPYVKDIWEIEGDGPHDRIHSLSFFADGRPGLFFCSSSGGMNLMPGNRKLSPLFLYGQTVKPIDILVNGPFKGVIVQLQPHAIKALYGVNASELTDTCLDAGLLERNFNPGLTDVLLNCETPKDRVDMLSAYILQLIQKSNTSMHEMMRYSIDNIMKSNGRVPLREIHQNLNISERTFERKFVQYVGISPRLFSRICSFYSAYNQLKASGYKRLSDIAYDNGYADQSHFIRTFREFTGLSPLQFGKSQIERVQDSVPGDLVIVER